MVSVEQQAPVEDPPDPIETPDVWSLRADPRRLDQAAQSWRDIARSARDSAWTVNSAAWRVDDHWSWESETARTYSAHRLRLTGDVDTAAALADDAALTLDSVAMTLRRAQHQLDEDRRVITKRVPHQTRTTPDGTVLVFAPRTQAQATAVTRAIAAARELRGDVEDGIDRQVASLRRTRARLTELAAAWDAVANQGVQPFVLPPETGPAWIYDPVTNRFIVNTGPGNDHIRVVVDPATEQRRILYADMGNTLREMWAVRPTDVMFTSRNMPDPLRTWVVPDGAEIVIRTGSGDDILLVPADARVRVTILGGSGNDAIRTGAGADTVLAGDGNDEIDAFGGDDRVSGGAGADKLTGFLGTDTLDGGAGNDVAYGGSGDDRLTGGEGNDYLDGGAGDDATDAGAGADVLSGGQGHDDLYGGAGDDVIYTGRGADLVDAGSGADTVYGRTDPPGPVRDLADRVTNAEAVVRVQVPAEHGTTIVVRGDDFFRERVLDDLETLNSSPNGVWMLSELDRLNHAGHTLTIQATDPEAFEDAGSEAEYGRESGDATIRYDIRDDIRGAPPIAIVYHEMAHVYDYDRGTIQLVDYEGQDQVDHRIWIAERQATGLPIDHDRDPTTPERIDPDHPFALTENGLRDEMDLPNRDHYR